MRCLARSVLALVARFAIINALITLWAFAAVVALWPELRPAADGTLVFPPSTHPAFKLEMLVNVPAAFLAGYACAPDCRSW